MKHVYLSPHLDDVVLSCGGTIHRYTTAGDPVQVITIFAGEFQGVGLSQFALQLHDEWGNLLQPMALRRAEDTAALTLLGAKAYHLDYLDAVYRTEASGQWIYTDLEALFGEVHPGDALSRGGTASLTSQLVDLMPSAEQAVVYAPLGVGCHVDHQIVHGAARQLLEMGCRVAFYEDYPYAERPDASEKALVAAGADTWRVDTVPLAAMNVSAKVSALGYYRSQMAVLFGGAEAMPSRVWSFAANCSEGIGLAERIWWPPEA